MTERTEVLIVGAGPAGSALALRLARAGVAVTIVEVTPFPREKPCGDFINPGALRELERLGVADRVRDELGPTRVPGWEIRAPDGTRFRAAYGTTATGSPLVGWAVRRKDLDAVLLREACRAGARVRFGFRVFDLEYEGSRVVGVTGREGTAVRTLRASFVVGADGLRSVVRRRLGLQTREARVSKIALVGHVLGAERSSRDTGELYVGRSRICGYAPLPVGANVTLVVGTSEAPRMAGAPRSYLLEALRDFPEVRVRLDGRSLERDVLVTGPFDRPVRRPWAPGVLLVGDAAGYYDPFTGQGVHQALRTAALAEAALAGVLRDRLAERRALARYGRAVRRELLPKRIVQHVIESVVSRPRWMNVFARILDADAGRTARRLVRVTGDLDPPGELLWPFPWLRALARAGVGRKLS